MYASLVNSQVHVAKSINRLDLPILHSKHCLASSRFIQMISFIVLFPLYVFEQSLLILVYRPPAHLFEPIPLSLDVLRYYI